MQLTEQQIQDNLVKLKLIQTKKSEKKRSFCRYFLRGLCVYTKENCHYSHGVNDLDYQDWTSEQIIEYDYLKQTDFCQKDTIKGPRIYKDLFEFQFQQGNSKLFNLDQLNQDRAKRLIIRREFHKKMFIEFMKMLEKRYPEAMFSEEFLVREYTRVGFNKLMTRIKFSHLTSHLCNDDDSEYFQLSAVMPPHVKQQRVFIVRKASDQEIDAFYKLAYEQIVKSHSQQTIDEGKVKKMLFGFVRPSIHIPPLNIHLKNKKCSFPIFLKSVLGQSIVELQIKFEADVPTLVESARKFLETELPNNLVQWNHVYKYLCKEHQLNNANIISQIKPILVLEGYRFLFFPMTQFIVHPQISSKLDFTQHEQCPCNYKKIFNSEQLQILNESLNNEALFELEHKESYDIYDLESLIQCAPSIYNSKVLGIDLEGRLRKNGYIEMIQLNNGQNTFLIDIYRMDLNGDIYTFELTKKLLRNVLLNPNILKIFHDCRHDSLALHQFMQCCINNIYDTSASQTYKGQLQMYEKLDVVRGQISKQKLNEKKQKQLQTKAKQAIAQANNVRTPGLNEILKTYNAPHGINKNKDLFHSMWNKGQTSLFDERPLNPDFREYCIKDVLDLPHVYQEMTKVDEKSEKRNQFDLELAKWVSSQYVKWGYLSLNEKQQNK